MRETAYNRQKAVKYAHKWAYDRSPKYYNFDRDGGDCTNFASQVLFAGCGVMNSENWYYKSVNDRAPAWSGVVELHRFLIANQGAGPYAAETAAMDTLSPGDLIQLKHADGDRFRHTLIVVDSSDGHILVAAHTLNSDNRPLSSYTYVDIRGLRILGARR